VEGNIDELEKYMNWRDELARAKVTDPNKRKQFIVVASSIAIFSVLSFFVCCLTMGGTCSIYIVAALRKLYRTNLFFLTRSMGCVFFFSKDICATLPSLLDIQRLSWSSQHHRFTEDFIIYFFHFTYTPGSRRSKDNVSEKISEKKSGNTETSKSKKTSDTETSKKKDDTETSNMKSDNTTTSNKKKDDWFTYSYTYIYYTNMPHQTTQEHIRTSFDWTLCNMDIEWPFDFESIYTTW
jgi:hypothetical protein